MDFYNMEVYLNSLETTSIHNLPDEILVQIFSNLSPKELIIPVCGLWSKIAEGELSRYKNEKMLLNYHLFRDMVTLIQPSEENIALMNIVGEKILSKEIFSEEFIADDVFFQPRPIPHTPSLATVVKNRVASIPNLLASKSIRVYNRVTKTRRSQVDVKNEVAVEQDFYKKLMNAMVKIIRTNKTNLLVLAYPSGDSKYQEFAIDTLSKRLFNLIYATSPGVKDQVKCAATITRLQTLILSRTVSANPEVIELLKLNFKSHELLTTVKLSQVCILAEDNPDYSAIGPISEMLTELNNLKNILINEFQMNDCDAIDLAKLIASKETLERCEIVGEGSLTNEGLGCIFVALRDREFETNFNFKLAFHSEDSIREGLTDLQSLDRPNLTITLEKIDSKPQDQE